MTAAASTELLYLTAPADRRFLATVLASTPRGIVLDKTLFYPRGGHQDCDRGYLLLGERRLAVTKVTSLDAVVYHRVAEEELLQPGARVEGVIEWDRRQYLSSLHSAQHVLSRLVLNRWKIQTLRSEFAEEGGNIEFAKSLDAGCLELLDQDFRAVVAQAVPFRRRFLPEGELRMEIDGFDDSPCGGTHVANSEELASTCLIGLCGARLVYDCGPRGFARVTRLARAAFAMKAMLGNPEDSVGALGRSLDEQREARVQFEAAARDSLASAMREDGPPILTGHRRVREIHRPYLNLKILRSVLAELPNDPALADVYLIVRTSGISIASPRKGVDAQALVRGLIELHPSARGGGNAVLADVSMPPTEVKIALAQVKELLTGYDARPGGDQNASERTALALSRGDASAGSLE